jgi:hypothetical protein
MTRILQKSFLLGSGTGAALILLFFLLSSTVASAGRYTIAYGFDDFDNSEAGKLDCKYDE